MLLNRKTYYLLSFIEGACVMAAELLGAKMLAPYFGSSLYVWATVLAITLGGLASGYFVGGEISFRSKNKLVLFYLVLLAALFLICMPFSSKLVLHYLQSQQLIPALIFSSLVFLLPPVFMMGMVSPLIIDALSEDKKNAGRIAGNIYAISTLGGIIATFLLGFHIIPAHGLTLPALVFGSLLGIIPVLVILQHKKILPVIFFIAVLLSLASSSKQKLPSDIKLLRLQEGILGQLMVVDYPVYKNQKVAYYSRILFCNRIMQTVYTPNDTAAPYLPYITKIEEHLSAIKAKKNVLMFGLGGGILATNLFKNNYAVDVVEFDERAVDISNTFFNLDRNVIVYVDDARHYLNQCTKKYDVIIFDVLKGEETPNHILTMESLQKAKALLNANGTIVLNGNGYLNGKAGRAMRSIYKTFLRSGFSVQTKQTHKNEAYSNAIFFASLNSSQLPQEKIDTVDAWVLRDDFPILDILSKEANQSWRMGYIQNSIRDFENRNIPLFE